MAMWLSIVLGFGWHVESAELRLRSQCQCTGALVRLGDVAEIFAAEKEQGDMLANVELFPAPSASRPQYVSLREIQDLLLLRGVKLGDHRLSGANQVAVYGSGGGADNEAPRSVGDASSKRAGRRLQEAVLGYLRQQEPSADASWTVRLEISPDHARLLSPSSGSIVVSGGSPPWTGLQRLTASVETSGGPVRFAFEAQVTAPQATVVAVRALPRGTMIRAADVQLQRGVSGSERSEGFAAVEDVVGRETMRAIAEGGIITRDAVQAPLLVRRGDAVTVCARSAGVCVRTTGRARDDGSLGDLITVESMLDRTSSYSARVTAIREVEVYGRAVRAESSAAARAARVVRR